MLTIYDAGPEIYCPRCGYPTLLTEQSCKHAFVALEVY
jgi:hypothetical protein